VTSFGSIAHSKWSMWCVSWCCMAVASRAHEWLDDMDDDLACTAGTVNNSKIVVAAVGDSITVGATCNTW
jgi:hypothetical protein